jgi:hypothetical protein
LCDADQPHWLRSTAARGSGSDRRQAARDVLDATLIRRKVDQVLAQHLGVLRVAGGAVHGLGDELLVQAQLGRRLLPECTHRRRVVGGKRGPVEIELQRAACHERVDVRMAPPAGAQNAHAGRQRMGQEVREGIASGRAGA